MSHQLLFRVNAGSKEGLGHLMRCLALAQSAETHGVKSHFWVNSEAIEFCKHRHDWVGEVYAIDNHLSELMELGQIAQFSQRHSVDAIVIDGYTFSEGYRKALKSLGLPVICFDDTNTTGPLWANIIINGAGNAMQLGYQQSNPDATLCLGAPYRVMRSEFVKSKPTPFDQRDELLITFGGSDPLGLTLPILRKLEQREFDGAVSVVTGAANQHVAEIECFVRASKLQVQHEHDCQTMAKKMDSARLVIAAAGGSQFELQARGCPSVLMVVADNQLNATQEAVKQGWCSWYDCRTLSPSTVIQGGGEELIEQLCCEIDQLWQNSDTLTQWHQNALSLAEVKGAQRVVETILAVLKDA